MNPLSSKVHFLAQTRQTKRRTNRTENHHEQPTKSDFGARVSRMRRRFSALSFDNRKLEWLAQDLGLRRLQTMKQICAEPIFLSLQKSDKRGSARRVSLYIQQLERERITNENHMIRKACYSRDPMSRVTPYCP